MADVPELSESVRRLHALRWRELVKGRGFTGDHLKWHESHDRRRRAAKPAFSLAPPPPTNVNSNSPRSSAIFYAYASQGEAISYDDWKQRQLAAWAARENDPDVIDSIGIAETIELAKARFAGIAGDYLSMWADTNRDSDEIPRWLEGIALLVGREVGDLWRK